MEPVIRNFEAILAQIGGIESVIASCLNDAKTIGRLKRMKDLDPFGLLHSEGASVRDGCPGYYGRIRLSLEAVPSYLSFFGGKGVMGVTASSPA